MNSFLCRALAFLGLMVVAFSASADPIFGTPQDQFTGCDSGGFGGRCDIYISENGSASASFTSFYPIGPPTNPKVSGPGPNNLNAVITHVASESDPTWVDQFGNPLEVTTFVLTFDSPYLGGLTTIFAGAVGLCDDGVTADFRACTGPNGDVKGDVIIFRPNADGSNTINLLSDVGFDFPFLTDFNVLEVGTEGFNGALYRSLGNEGGGEDVYYHITSDAPEPQSLLLLGIGLAGLGFSRRRNRV